MIFYNVPVFFHSWNHYQHCKIDLSPACCLLQKFWIHPFNLGVAWHFSDSYKKNGTQLIKYFLIAKQMFILD